MKTLRFGAVITALSMLAIAAHDVNAAATIRVRCEQRANRSKISIDGSNLATGLYKAIATSGSKKAQSGTQATVGDEVEFDFDSNPADIAAGATAIPKNFIVGGKVKGQILDNAGKVVATQTVTCQVK